MSSEYRSPKEWVQVTEKPTLMLGKVRGNQQRLTIGNSGTVAFLLRNKVRVKEEIVRAAEESQLLCVCWSSLACAIVWHSLDACVLGVVACGSGGQHTQAPYVLGTRGSSCCILPGAFAQMLLCSGLHWGSWPCLMPGETWPSWNFPCGSSSAKSLLATTLGELISQTLTHPCVSVCFNEKIVAIDKIEFFPLYHEV